VGQLLDHRLRLDAGLADARQRGLEAAFGGLAGALGLGTAADLVPILGQVREVAEIGEGADHADGLGRAEALEQVLQRAVGRLVGIAPEGHRERADLLDQRKALLAFLLPDHVAEDPAQQPDVGDQRLVVVVGPTFDCGGSGARLHSKGLLVG
jgi:hypothetical protein